MWCRRERLRVGASSPARVDAEKARAYLLDMIRIAILGSRGYPSYYGGFETLVRHLAPFLALQGHAVTVYGRDRRSGRTVVLDNGITVRNTWGFESKSASTLSFGLSASVDLARRGCDAALILNVANGFYIRTLKRAGVGTCVNVDGVEWLRQKWGRGARSVFRRGARLVAAHADELIYDSEALRGIWEREFGRGDGHYIAYGTPVLTGVTADKLIAAGLPTAGYVLVVARVAPENNVDLLLDAIDLLPERPAVIVVGDGNYRQPTITRLRQLEADGSIHWLGHVSDQDLLDQLWAHAGVYWHGHSVGGTNPALLQALGAGAPTLAFESVFNREVIGRESQLVPPDPGVLAARISEVLGSREVAEAHRRAGVETVRSRYAWEDICGNYCALLEATAQRTALRREVTKSARELKDTTDGLT